MRQRHSSVVISPSLSSTDWGKLKEILRKVQSAGIDTVHCDIEDGNFVPNISFGPKIIEKIIDLTELPVSVHLMVANPELVLKMLSGIKINEIFFHYESTDYPYRVIQIAKEISPRIGLALNPKTFPLVAQNILYYVDSVLIVMTEPDLHGELQIESVTNSIHWLNNFKNETGLSFQVCVDGGVNRGNIRRLYRSGARTFICGRVIWEPLDMSGVVENLRKFATGESTK